MPQPERLYLLDGDGHVGEAAVPVLRGRGGCGGRGPERLLRGLQQRPEPEDRVSSAPLEGAGLVRLPVPVTPRAALLPSLQPSIVCAHAYMRVRAWVRASVRACVPVSVTLGAGRNL